MMPPLAFNAIWTSEQNELVFIELKYRKEDEAAAKYHMSVWYNGSVWPVNV